MRGSIERSRGSNNERLALCPSDCRWSLYQVDSFPSWITSRFPRIRESSRLLPPGSRTNANNWQRDSPRRSRALLSLMRFACQIRVIPSEHGEVNSLPNFLNLFKRTFDSDPIKTHVSFLCYIWHFFFLISKVIIRWFRVENSCCMNHFHIKRPFQIIPSLDVLLE